ncbi:swi5-dependent recombination DNA repair protein 1 homolog isoform X2 [Halichondria panicea]|uniref:swi5-dependent recombination DNA repair protein 1 homolog isoform X2 n=1 Tax=Halichondria panicea TaxID=6063 RepID=UPI00312B6F0C
MAAPGPLESKLLEHFREVKCPILQEEELKVWWEKEELKDGLSESLKVLVERGRLGGRTLSVGKNQIKIYWLKDGGHQCGSTPGASKRGPKRSQSRFVSPLIKDRREKRPKLDAAMDTVKGSLDFSGEDGSSSTELGRLSEKKATLLTRLKERKEELRKLRMVKMYRTKPEHQGLDVLTQQWREVSQEVAQSLLESSTHQPPPTMQQLLDYLHIDHDLIHYSVEDESFY